MKTFLFERKKGLYIILSFVPVMLLVANTVIHLYISSRDVEEQGTGNSHIGCVCKGACSNISE